MQLAQLELFVAVVEHGGMTAAGRELGLTQPAVSRSIANLEQQLGVALFRRDGRSVEVTEAGDYAYRELKALTGDWHRISAELRRRGGRPDHVTIAVPFGTARVLLPLIIRRATNAIEDLVVNVVERASPDSILAVAQHEYAMALVYPEQPSEVGGLIPVATEQFYAVGRPDLLGADGSPIDLADVAKLPLLLSEPTWSIRRTIDRACAERNITLRVVREVGIADALMAFALEGDGVTILPLSNVVRERELGTLAAREITNPRIERVLALAVSPELPASVTAELSDLFRSVLTDAAAVTNWQVIAPGPD